MRTRAEVRESFLAILRKHVLPGVSVTAVSTVGGDLSLDSLAVMELVADVEDAFGITIPDDSLAELRTVADVEDALVSHLKSRGKLAP